MCVLLAQLESRQECARSGGNWVSRLTSARHPPSTPRSTVLPLLTHGHRWWDWALPHSSRKQRTHFTLTYITDGEQEEEQGAARVFYAPPGIALYTSQVNNRCLPLSLSWDSTRATIMNLVEQHTDELVDEIIQEALRPLMATVSSAWQGRTTW